MHDSTDWIKSDGRGARDFQKPTKILFLPLRGFYLLFTRHVLNNPVYLFFHSPKNWGPMVLRMAMAGYFLLHGSQHCFGVFGGTGWHGTIAAWSSSFGASWPSLFLSALLVGELLAGLSFFLGFLTRLAGLSVVIALLFRVSSIANAGGGLTDLELPVILYAVGLALVCLGGGSFSTDRLISNNLLPSVG